MKKIILLSALVVSTVFTSCKKEEPMTPEPTPIIINETTPPPPPPPTEKPAPVEQKVDEDGTAISINSDGVSLDTKDGKKSTTVKVQDGGAAIEIKK